MKLLTALIESFKNCDYPGVIYKDIEYFYDPYNLETTSNKKRSYNEFRANIGTFSETLLWNHIDFNSQTELGKLKNMYKCEEYKAIL